MAGLGGVEHFPDELTAHGATTRPKCEHELAAVVEHLDSEHLYGERRQQLMM